MPPKTLQQIVTNVETDPKWVGFGGLDKAVATIQGMYKSLGVPFQYMNAGHLALARMAFGARSDFSTVSSTLVPNDHIYGFGKDTGLLIVDNRHSIIFRNPQAAANAHSNGEEIDASKAYDKLRQVASPHASEALKTGVLLVNRESYPYSGVADIALQNLPTDALGQLDVPVFVFGGEKTATVYGNWLKSEAKIDYLMHSVLCTGYTELGYPGRQGKQVVRPLMIYDISSSSQLSGRDSLAHGNVVRWVSLVPVWRAAQKILV